MTEFTESTKENETVDAETEASGAAEEETATAETAAETTPEATDSEADVAADAETEKTSATETEDGAAEQTTDPDDTEPTMAEAMAEQYDEATRTLSRGELVEGRVVDIVDGEVHVDVGYKSEGRIPTGELGLPEGQTPEEAVKIDDKILVQVLQVNEEEGTVVLSKRRAQERGAWKELTEKHDAGEIIEAEVTGRVKGGLLVDVGVRGFVPASHADVGFVDNLDQFVGQTLRFRIIELDRQRRNVVLSRKELLEEELQEAKEKAFATLEEGQLVSGIVRRLTDFGAFVDIGDGVEGLLHVSEMAWSRVGHPKDVLSEGDEIEIKVLGVDAERERISLSLKAATPDPWTTVDERYSTGQVTTGEVTRTVDFGAFVKLEDGVEGLVHISQLAEHHVEDPAEIVQPGEQVEVRVVNLDPGARRIGLSMREPAPKRERERPRPERRQRGRQPAEATSYTDPGPENVTIGDVTGLQELRNQLAQQNNEEDE